MKTMLKSNLILSQPTIFTGGVFSLSHNKATGLNINTCHAEFCRISIKCRQINQGIKGT